MESLRPIYNPLNSYLTERKYDNAFSKFNDLTKIAGCLPRTEILKKDIYMNEAGECKETTGGLPKGWAKGKLIGRKGQEMPDADYKALNMVETKAKAPKENKGK